MGRKISPFFCCCHMLLLLFFKAMDQPPFFFIGLMIYAIVGQKLTLFALLDDLQLPLGVAFGGFFVEQGRVFGGAALGAEAGDGDVPAVTVFADAQLHADLNVFAGFGALLVDMHFATVDGFGGQRARLKKTRRPQPLI